MPSLTLRAASTPVCSGAENSDGHCRRANANLQALIIMPGGTEVRKGPCATVAGLL